MVWLQTLALLPLLIWLYLLLLRDGFWHAGPRLAEPNRPPAAWPAVTVVVPARNEAETIEVALASLLAQDYPGPLAIVVVDDHSEDQTRSLIQQAISSAPTSRLVELVDNPPLPAGWAGKLWAVHNGLRLAYARHPAPYLLLTDADIEHDTGNLRRLVGKAAAEQLDLVSLMVRLRCLSLPERFLIPPFIFFFQLLYPFPAVNDPARRIAAAAGGCVLLRAAALTDAGGIGAIKGEVIDDVALARRIKASGGRIWLGLAGRTRSLRAYDGLAGIWRMVTRTADSQLRHSLSLLIVAIFGLGLVFLIPVVLIVLWPWHGDLRLLALGLGSWLLMSLAFLPTVRLQAVAWPWTLSLPAASAVYGAMTIASAIRYRRRGGNAWKGRVIAG